MADNKSAMQVDAALVRQLAELLDENMLTEIEVQDGERKIRVARAGTTVAAAAAPVAVAAPTPVAEAPAAAPSTANAIKSPMVGTVFLAAEPGAKPFAGVGDIVTEGQTLVIIEAMKVMNPIAAPRAGRVVQVMVENGQPVEFDQPLLVIE
jgi:acetyl-CoA carboxylase biotin carboxyl carrier protein